MRNNLYDLILGYAVLSGALKVGSQLFRLIESNEGGGNGDKTTITVPVASQIGSPQSPQAAEVK